MKVKHIGTVEQGRMSAARRRAGRRPSLTGLQSDHSPTASRQRPPSPGTPFEQTQGGTATALPGRPRRQNLLPLRWPSFISIRSGVNLREPGKAFDDLMILFCMDHLTGSSWLRRPFMALCTPPGVLCASMQPFGIHS